MKVFFKRNLLILCFLAFFIITELTAVFVTSGEVYIRHPWIFIGLCVLFTVILYVVRNQKARYIVGLIFLTAVGVADGGFVLLFEMTETLFEFPMINLRGEAVSILDSLTIDFVYTLVFGTCLSIYAVAGWRMFPKLPEIPKLKRFPVAVTVLLVFSLSVNLLAVEAVRPYKDVGDNLLYGNSVNAYSELGVSGNLIYELANGIFAKEKFGELTDAELEDFIYDKDGIYYTNFPENAKKKYNLVTILCESLEWFSFIQNTGKYPNGYNLENTNILAELYPNLNRFYNESVVMTNFHAREKTDISENYALIGSYPTKAFINYTFPENYIATSLLNNLKITDESVVCSYFHNGFAAFYNRTDYLTNLGFDKVVFSEDMAKCEGFTDWSAYNERNLDHEMIKVCKDEMFPTERRFYTFITSITMHGVYAYRQNLDDLGYYDKLESAGIKVTEKDNTLHDTFVHYLAAVMEFDRALGEIYKVLEEKNLLDNTIIAIFSDHNTFYQGLSRYVKSTSTPALFEVPFMIRCPGIDHRVIEKFTCTADIVPTLCDLLGLNVYGNLYFGNSVFSEKESVLYSRAYGVFITDKIYFYNLNRIIWADTSCDDEYMKALIDRATALTGKITACNRIFYNDYFSKSGKASMYEDKMRDIN